MIWGRVDERVRAGWGVDGSMAGRGWEGVGCGLGWARVCVVWVGRRAEWVCVCVCLETVSSA